MAVLVVALNSAFRLNDAEANTNWSNLGGGGPSPAAEAQLKYQGSNAVNRKVTTTGSRTGVQFAGGTARDISGGGLMIWKGYVADFGDLNAAYGIEAVVGSDASNFYAYNVAGSGANGPPFDAGYPAKGGYLIIAIDPEVVGWREATTGTPVLTAVDYAGIAAQFVAGGAKSENVALDAIDLVLAGGGLLMTRGDGASPVSAFQDLVDWDEGTSGNRYGLAVNLGSIIVLRSMITIGESATATEFTDNDAIVIFPNGYHSAGSFGLTYDLGNASTIVEVGATIIGEGNVTTEDTRPDFIATGTAATTLMRLTGTLINHRNVTLTSKVDADGCSIECQLLTQASAEIQNATILTDAITSVACLQDPTFGISSGLRDTDFIQAGVGHAIEIKTAGTYTFTGLTFTGYGADTTNDAAIDITETTGTVTINYTGVAPTYKTAGATVVLQASADYTLTNVKNLTEITILDRDVSLLDITGTASNQNVGNVAASEKVGQSFQVGTAGKAERIRLNLRKVGTPTDGLRIRLTNGVPGSTELLVSTYVPADDLTTAYVEFDVNLDGKSSLALATTYGIEIERSGALDASNYYQVEYDTASVHGSGVRYLFNVTWGTTTGDLLFSVMESASDNELYTVASVTTGTTTWTHDGTVREIEVLAMSLAFKAFVLIDNVSGADKSVPISQEDDLVYSNP